MSGSDLHEAGDCRPCIFFHKDGGCSNGEECDFCHTCAPDAVVRRKKARKEEVKQFKRENPGSKDHPDECRPCAFFHPKEGKTRSCADAASCEFCHLCPPGELLRRKKCHRGKLREEAKKKSRDMQSHPKDNGTTFVPGVGVVNDEIWEKAQHLSIYEKSRDHARKDTGNSAEETARVTFVPEVTSVPRLSTRTLSQSEENAATPAHHGSQAHPTDCKPCAFFHKEQGCLEADQCIFCHVCPAGAARSSQKKKKKAVKLLKKMRESSYQPGLSDDGSSDTVKSPPGLDCISRDTVSTMCTTWRASEYSPMTHHADSPSNANTGTPRQNANACTPRLTFRRPPGLPSPNGSVDSSPVTPGRKTVRISLGDALHGYLAAPCRLSENVPRTTRHFSEDWHSKYNRLGYFADDTVKWCTEGNYVRNTTSVVLQ